MDCVSCKTPFSPKVWNQRYCSTPCQERHYNKNYNASLDRGKYRHKSDCTKCGKFTRIRKKDGWCESCSSMARCGFARKPNKGTCKTCDRGPFTLSAGKCKSCYVHGVFRGIPSKTSHGEVLLREAVANQYPGLKIEHNYKPDWLVRKGRLEIDVAIPSIKVGFEFDGRPHWDPKHPGFIKTRTNDVFKAKKLKEFGWTLIKLRTERMVADLGHILDSLDQYYEYAGATPEFLIKQHVICVHPGVL